MSDDPSSEEQEDISSDEEDGLTEDSAPLAEPQDDIGDPEVAEDVNLPDDAAPDAFSQDELDRMVGGPATVEGVAQVFRADGELISEDVDVRQFDFRNPVFLSEKEVNQVRARNDKFAFYLGQNLAMELRMGIDFTVTNLSVQQYAQFTQSIESPSHVSLFKINELTGVGLLEISPVLALGMVDRALGGKGVASQDLRFLTAIESAMVDDIAQIIVDEWCHQWDGYMELSAQVIGQETTGRFLQTSSFDSPVIVLAIEANLGEIKETIRIGIPYYTVTPILTKIQEVTQKANKATGKEGGVPWKNTYDNISVQVNSEWAVSETTVKGLLGLQEGDFLDLGPNILQQTRITIAGKDCFLGEYGKEGDGVAVKITEKLST
ncbi:MAG: flagellar motor switch protein FliM [Opitutae bacterium]|nr:flagellar motor switch protein FliM [Opitutae bacterium]